jgi:hypothetical protein
MVPRIFQTAKQRPPRHLQHVGDFLDGLAARLSVSRIVSGAGGVFSSGPIRAVLFSRRLAVCELNRRRGS